VLLAGCATIPHVSGLCRDQALYAACTWEDLTGDAVQIASGKTPSGTGHAQARADIEGEWFWLNVIWPEVWADGRQQNFVPDRAWTPDEFYRMCVSRGWK
jgi:hypothetical protein